MNIEIKPRRRGPWRFDHARPVYVYLHIGANGEALYVGCTVNPEQRTAGHRSTAPWWDQVADIAVIGPFDREHGYEIEREFIWELSPPFNRRGVAA